MYSTGVPLNPTRPMEDFSAKVQHNFKLQVLLCLKGGQWNRHDILRKIYSLKGYKCHKVVRYGTNWSHLHIKFSEEWQAKGAIMFFTKLNPDLSAVLVDDLLRDWHCFETRSTYNHPWTVAVVDIVGVTPRSLNFLTENLLNYMLKDFGQPYILPYTAALNETHVQVLFSSMTEALAACMAFGQWYERYQKTDQFCYRVRINPCHKEAFLISNSGGTPEQAFQLDYFVTAAYEINHKRGFNQNGALSVCKAPDSADVIQRGKQNLIKDEPLHRENGAPQVKSYSPIVFVPIIAPMDFSTPQALAAAHAVTGDIAESLLKLQNEFFQTAQPVTFNQEVMQISTNIPESSVKTLESKCVSGQRVGRQTDKELTDFASTSALETVSVQKRANIPKVKRKNMYKGNSLVFERRVKES